jgi:hypothetical protein
MPVNVPESALGKKGRCPSCKTVFALPTAAPLPQPTPSELQPLLTAGSMAALSPLTSVSPLPMDDHFALAPRLEEQWFVQLADGRQFGPATWQQCETAMNDGRIPPNAWVRRGDWTSPVPAASLQRPQQSPTTVPTNPYGTASQQLRSNPVGTLLYGVKMPAYRGTRDPQSRQGRGAHFRLWVYAWLGLVAAACLIPGLLSSLYVGPIAIPVGIAMGVFFAFWPSIFYGLGLFCYAGALFEWQAFMNDKRARGMRSSLGDSGARKFYLGMGMFLMIPSLVVLAGMVVFLSIGTLMAGDYRKASAQPNATVQPQPMQNTIPTGPTSP